MSRSLPLTHTPILESLHVYLNGVEQYQPQDWGLSTDSPPYVVPIAAMEATSGDLLEARYVCGPPLPPLEAVPGQTGPLVLGPTPTEPFRQHAACSVINTATLAQINMPVEPGAYGAELMSGPQIGWEAPDVSSDVDYISFPAGWGLATTFTYWAYYRATGCWVYFAVNNNGGSGADYGVTGRRRNGSNSWSVSSNWLGVVANNDGYLAYFAAYVTSGSTYLAKIGERGARPGNAL